MIASTWDFVTEFFTAHPEFNEGNVLEVGSLNDGDGSILERLPKGVKYTGTDMHEGAIKKGVPDYWNNVHVLINAHDLLTKFQPESFDVVFCFDTLEHDDMFWLSWENIKAVTKKGGYIVLGTPGRFCPKHTHPDNYPGDYWRFMEHSFKEYFFKDFEDVYTKVITNEEWNQVIENEIYGWGKKV